MLHPTLLLSNIGAPELILIVLVILLLFGGKKIPELMKGLGKGVKSFKDGMNEIQENMDEKPDTKAKSQQTETKQDDAPADTATRTGEPNEN
jgi:sec-independent protein translocase protein TatA